MKLSFKKQTLILAAGLCSALPMQAAQACSADSEYIASICIMAMPSFGDFGRAYLVADGRTLPIAAYSALFALIGYTYGGNNSSTMALPDLRGRVVVGAGQGAGLPPYQVGTTGGATSFTLTSANLPAHSHTLNGQGSTKALAASTSNLQGATTLQMTLNASTGGAASTNPAGASLGTYSGAVKVYSDAVPTVAMKAGSIGGTASTTISGTITTNISGATDPAGLAASTVIPTMPPYLVMTYYIAAQGIFPSRD